MQFVKILFLTLPSLKETKDFASTFRWNSNMLRFPTIYDTRSTVSEELLLTIEI